MWLDPCTLLVGMYTDASVIKNSVAVPLKIQIELPYNPAILLLGIYPEEWELGFSKKHLYFLFTAALFLIAKKWKPPKYLLTDEWIKKTFHIHTVKYYSALKKMTDCLT